MLLNTLKPPYQFWKITSDKAVFVITFLKMLCDKYGVLLYDDLVVFKVIGSPIILVMIRSLQLSIISKHKSCSHSDKSYNEFSSLRRDGKENIATYRKAYLFGWGTTGSTD